MLVGDQFRTNPLSEIPGGSVIRIIDMYGNDRTYDKIKSPSAYISKLNLSDIKNIFINGRELKIIK